MPRLKDFIDVNSVSMVMFSGIKKCPDTNVRIHVLVSNHLYFSIIYRLEHKIKMLNKQTSVVKIFSSPPSWCPWDIFISFKICSDAKERVGCGKQRAATAPIKSLVKLQPWLLRLQ